MLEGTTTPKDKDILFRLVELLVFVFRLVTPSSYLYLFVLFYLKLTPDQLGGPVIYTLLTTWMVIEALFFPYYYFLFVKLNKSKSELQHFASTRESRQLLVKNCFEAMRISASTDPIGSSSSSNSSSNSNSGGSPEVYIRKVIQGWFLDVPMIDIYYENFFAWSGWAFFGKEVSDMTDEEIAENKDIVAYIETEAKWKFPAGHSKEIHSARLTIDPVFSVQRPFFFYGTIIGINWGCHVILKVLGYRRRSEFDTTGQTIYHRPASVSSTNSSKKAHPIVFIHGIGVGLIHYLALICCFPKEVDVYIVEWPYVAMQMTTDSPSMDRTVSTFIRMLDEDNHSQACFVAHSLGTTAVSWMVKDPEGVQRVASTVLMDPVTFLLCDPTVATAFVYKDPTSTIDFIMHFFLSRELFIANALSRNFNWSHNIMFVEDLVKAFPRPEFFGTRARKLSPSSVVSAPSGSDCGSSDNSDNNIGNDIDSEDGVLGRGLRKRNVDTNNRNNNSNSNSNSNSNNNNSSSSSSSSSSGSNSSSSSSSSSYSNPKQQQGKGGGQTDNLNHTVFLSSHDAIVPVANVTRYLSAKSSTSDNNKNFLTFKCFELVLFHGIHGEMFVYPHWVGLITHKIKERCGLTT